ncbi:MAG: uracil-DNA glycosylase [Magnetococcales bacterium]|nr:uracil-DNA glycosylase [Magnetococcales bacterium]
MVPPSGPVRNAPTARPSASISVPQPVLANQTTMTTTRRLSDAEKVQELDRLRQEVLPCQRCALSASRIQTVFGVGDPTARVVFVGEAPGAEEDKRGEPFVGQAGKLLDRMLASIGLDRGQIYIANVLKCRPPANRNPAPEEVALCQGFLFRQLEIIQPVILFALGRFAIESLLGHTGPIGAARNRSAAWRGIPVVASYHPAFYLRQSSRKKDAWDDLQRLEELMTEHSF